MDVVRQGESGLRYRWYIDVFFFVNFSMNLILLLLSGKILKRRAARLRLCGSAALGAVIACAAVWGTGYLTRNMTAAATGAVFLAAGLAAPVLMVRLAFRPESARELARETMLFLFAAVCVGGGMGLIYDHTMLGYGLARFLTGGREMSLAALCFAAFGAVFLFRYLWLAASETRKEKERLCMVTLRAGEKRLEAMAYRDSGNSLTEPESGGPVSVVSERVWKELKAEGAGGGRIRWLSYRTIGNPFGVMEAMQIDSIEECGRVLRGQNRLPPAGSAAAAGGDCRPWVARAPFPVSQDGSYDVLLHREL